MKFRSIAYQAIIRYTFLRVTWEWPGDAAVGRRREGAGVLWSQDAYDASAGWMTFALVSGMR